VFPLTSLSFSFATSLVFCFFVLCGHTPVYATTPLVKIVSPTDGQTVVGQEVTVSFILGNAVFGSEAHLHLWLDISSPSASTATEIASHHDHILSGLSPGIHTLTLEAVRPDHQSFVPAVQTISTFTLQPPVVQPTVTPSPPSVSSSLPSQKTLIGIGAAAIFLLVGGTLYLTGKRE